MILSLPCRTNKLRSKNCSFSSFFRILQILPEQFFNMPVSTEILTISKPKFIVF